MNFIMIVTYEAIAQRAFDIWKREGCPQGCDQDHWLRAECELRNESIKEQEARGVLTSDPALLRTPDAHLAGPVKANGRQASGRGARARAGARP